MENKIQDEEKVVGSAIHFSESEVYKYLSPIKKVGAFLFGGYYSIHTTNMTKKVSVVVYLPNLVKRAFYKTVGRFRKIKFMHDRIFATKIYKVKRAK